MTRARRVTIRAFAAQAKRKGLKIPIPPRLAREMRAAGVWDAGVHVEMPELAPPGEVSTAARGLDH